MRSVYAAALALAGLLCSAGVANAIPTQPYGTFVGTDFTFIDVQETTNAGDPAQLFEAPVVVGNVLLFDPSAFTATASNGASADNGSQLQFDVEGNTGTDYIDKITIQEFGDSLFVGGTAGTWGYINMTMFVTVLEINGVADLKPTQSVVGTFTLGPLFDSVSTPGSQVWSGTAFIDVSALYANVTKVKVALDNDLLVFSETGSFAKIQKKVADGVVVTVPEPTTLALLACAGLALVLRGRRP